MAEGHTAHDRLDLGDGLIRRWSTAADTERLVQLMGDVWRQSPDDPPNLRVADSMRRCMRGDYPFMGSGDCALIKDTTQPGSPIVACTTLLQHTWTYAGIPFGVGRPESVATDPAYRNRGLVRSLLDLVQARSEAEGHLVQAITGIPYFYRQFGYEYALDFDAKQTVFLAVIPALPAETVEPFALRLATVDDVPTIAMLYDQRRDAGLVRAVVPDYYWRYRITSWDEPAIRELSPSQHGVTEQLLMIVDPTGATWGYVLVYGKRFGAELAVISLEIKPGADMQVLVPSLLRALQRYGERLVPVYPSTPQFSAIGFSLGRVHPFYEVLDRDLMPIVKPPYAWLLRVPDLPALLRHIAPELERRLAASALAGHTGDLSLDFFRSGLRLRFASGCLTSIEPWRATVYPPNADATFPPSTFLQLLFGYRTLDELRYAYPDIGARPTAEILLQALFPAQPSWVMAF